MTVNAQTSHQWSLRECIDYALANNINIKQKDVTRRERVIDVSTAKNNRLPDLNAEGSQRWTFGRGINSNNIYSDHNIATTTLGLSTSVPLFTGYKIPRMLELSKLNLEAATSDLEKARNDISIQVAQAYVQILYDLELSDVAMRQVSIDSMQVERLRSMYEEGKASGVEVAQQESQLGQSRLTLTQAKNDYHIDLLSLAQLLELPSTDNFTIVRPNADAIEVISEVQLPSPNDVYNEAVVVKPEIAAGIYRLRGAETNVKVAKSALFPTLSFVAGIGSQYFKTYGIPAESLKKQLNNNFDQYFGLSLSVPIFNRFSTRNEIRTARLGVESRQLELDDAKKVLYKEIQQVCCNAVAAKSKYESSSEAARSSRIAYELVEAKYIYGKATITEFNEAKANWLKAESDVVRAKYEYMYDKALIDFYRGSNINF
ncbi:MAG: TolC family protein [Prevotella sp.]